MFVLDRFFFIWRTKKRSLVPLEKSSLYAVTIALESDGTSSMLVVLGEWLSYGGCLNRFDSAFKLAQLSSFNVSCYKIIYWKCFVWVYLGSNFETVVPRLKWTASNLQKWNLSCKTKKLEIWEQSYCHIWNQLLPICPYKTKTTKTTTTTTTNLGQQMSDLGI